MPDQTKIIVIAKARALQNGWPFVEPLSFFLQKSWLGEQTYIGIATNALAKGAKARFVIDVSNGEIISEGYIPR